MLLFLHVFGEGRGLRATTAPLIVAHHGQLVAGELLQAKHVSMGQTWPTMDGDEYIVRCRITHHTHIEGRSGSRAVHNSLRFFITYRLCSLLLTSDVLLSFIT